MHSGKLAPMMIVKRAQLAFSGRACTATSFPGSPFFSFPFPLSRVAGIKATMRTRLKKQRRAKEQQKPFSRKTITYELKCLLLSSFGSVHTSPEEFEEGFTLKTHQMLSHHTKPEEFEDRCFTLKTHQMFPVHTTPE